MEENVDEDLQYSLAEKATNGNDDDLYVLTTFELHSLDTNDFSCVLHQHMYSTVLCASMEAVIQAFFCPVIHLRIFVFQLLYSLL